MLQTTKTGNKVLIPENQLKALIAEISQANLMATVDALSAFTTRHAGWTNAQDVADAIKAMFIGAGLTNISQPSWLDYDYTGVPEVFGTVDIIHVVGEIRGCVYPNKIIVLSAHHDSYEWSVYEPDSYGNPAPGADDNATGVACLVELARVINLGDWRPDYTLRFVSFGGEEIGLIGSGLYVDQYVLANDEQIVLNINMDMIGYTDVMTGWEMLLHPYDTDNNETDNGNSYFDNALDLIPQYTELSPMKGTDNFYVSDSYSFWTAGFPAIYFEEHPRTPHYHTIDDTSANLVPEYFTEMTKAVFVVLAVFSNLQERIKLNNSKGVYDMPTTFTDNLSTLETISAFEKEVNSQAGYTQKWGLYSADGNNKATVTTDTSVAYVVVTLTNGQTQTITGAGGASIAGVIEIPTSQIIDIKCYSVTNTLIDTFTLNEGYGESLFGVNGDLSGLLSDPTAWVLCKANRTWQDKIDLAKLILSNDVESILTDKGIVVNEADGEVLLDVITNPTTFRIACDYKSLNLIYDDLAQGGFNQLFESKAKQYKAKYDQELADAIKRMNLDPGLSGDTTEYRAEFTARVTR